MRTEKQIRFLLEHFEGLAQNEQGALERAEQASDSTEVARAAQQLLIDTNSIHILQWVLGEREAIIPVGTKTA